MGNQDELEAFLNELAEQAPSLGTEEARLVLRGLCRDILSSCARAIHDAVRTDFEEGLRNLETAAADEAVVNDRRMIANAVLDRIASVGGLPDHSPFSSSPPAPPPPAGAMPFPVEDASDLPDQEIERIRGACRATA